MDDDFSGVKYIVCVYTVYTQYYLTLSITNFVSINQYAKTLNTLVVFDVFQWNLFVHHQPRKKWLAVKVQINQQ